MSNEYLTVTSGINSILPKNSDESTYIKYAKISPMVKKIIQTRLLIQLDKELSSDKQFRTYNEILQNEYEEICKITGLSTNEKTKKEEQ
jgi:hypothetical protein